MQPFDLEQGKLSVRVSEGVYYQLLADIEEFNFKKTNGNKNSNAFFNKLLPNLISFRFEKRKDLRDFLENNFKHCIKDNFKNKVFDIMDDLFDTVYFDDYRENYHRHILHFRLNKTNIIELQSFFDDLNNQNQNKTSYLRNLFNEYANMRKDKRESVCFSEEIALLNNAVKNKLLISCSYNNDYYNLIPFTIDLNYIDDSLYLLALESKRTNICHTFKISSIRNITIKTPYEFKFDNTTLEKLKHIIYKYDYTNKDTLNLKLLKHIY